MTRLGRYWRSHDCVLFRPWELKARLTQSVQLFALHEPEVRSLQDPDLDSALRSFLAIAHAHLEAHRGHLRRPTLNPVSKLTDGPAIRKLKQQFSSARSDAIRAKRRSENGSTKALIRAMRALAALLGHTCWHFLVRSECRIYRRECMQLLCRLEKMIRDWTGLDPTNCLVAFRAPQATYRG